MVYLKKGEVDESLRGGGKVKLGIQYKKTLQILLLRLRPDAHLNLSCEHGTEY